MTIADINKAISALATKRPYFYSEADFQHALALELAAAGLKVYLEYPVSGIIPGRREVHIDIIVIDGTGIYPIELKYKTKKLRVKDITGSYIDLKNHSAQDINTYLFWKDVQRVESLASTQVTPNFKFKKGFVVFLTNDAAYYTPGSALNTIYTPFALCNSQAVQNIHWQHPVSGINYTAGKVTYPAFSLQQPYTPQWQSYNKDFEYLIIQV